MSKKEKKVELINGLTPFEVFNKGVNIREKLLLDTPEYRKELIELGVLDQGERLTVKHKGDRNYKMSFGAGCYMQLSSDYYNYMFDSEEDIDFSPNHKELVKLTKLKVYEKLSDEEKTIFNSYVDMHWNLKEIESKDLHDSDSYNTDYFSVLHFPVSDLYIRFDGYYSSEDGITYNSHKEVRPKIKEITVYE